MNDVDALTAPAMVFAIHHRYAPGEIKVRSEVESRLVLWAVSGRGTVLTAGRELTLEPGVVVVLPWHHDITYRADSVDPFCTGTVHLVPWLSPDHEVVPMAAHGMGDPLYHDPHRGDVPWPGYERVTVLRDSAAQRVSGLGTFGIEYFTLGEFDPRLLRAHAVALIGALFFHATSVDPRVPASLSAVLEYVRLHLGEPMTRQDLARVGGCSTSAIERQFKRHLGTSPVKWIRDERLALAARMLTTTTLRVSEVAKHVGIDDPLHFSRLFRARHGVPPREFARRSPLR